jgi:hypothetical protein
MQVSMRNVDLSLLVGVSVVALAAGCSGASSVAIAGAPSGPSDAAACDGQGPACCAGASCDAGPNCLEGRCAPVCGAAGEPCCREAVCDGPLACGSGGKCVSPADGATADSLPDGANGQDPDGASEAAAGSSNEAGSQKCKAGLYTGNYTECGRLDGGSTYNGTVSFQLTPAADGSSFVAMGRFSSTPTNSGPTINADFTGTLDCATDTFSGALADAADGGLLPVDATYDDATSTFASGRWVPFVNCAYGGAWDATYAGP